MDEALKLSPEGIQAEVDAALKDLVVAHRKGRTTFINLPLLYPDGSSVTVRVDAIRDRLRISDNGYAYREVHAVGAERSFAQTAWRILEDDGLSRDRDTIFVDVPADQAFRAICDVGMASWRITDRIYSQLPEDEEIEIEDSLTERLIEIFGESRVSRHDKLAGASTNEWDVTAAVTTESSRAVFQAVSNHPNSIFKTTAAFHDIRSLRQPPRLIAVVRDKAELGRKLALLSGLGRVIEIGQSEATYQRAAA